eukprot:2877500-Alexandrium_andersonii.AAC.1
MGLLIEADKKVVGQAFRPRQFAAGVSGGAEAMAKAAQTLADTKGFAAARLDGKSAFNSQGQGTALNRLAEVSAGLANALA